MSIWVRIVHIFQIFKWPTIRPIFGGNGNLPRFSIGNPKYIGGLKSPSGSKSPPLDLMVDQQKFSSPLWAPFHAHSHVLFPLEFVV